MPSTMAEIVSYRLRQQAKEQGFYSQADIVRVAESIADDIILESMAVGVAAPQLADYAAKTAYIAEHSLPLY